MSLALRAMAPARLLRGSRGLQSNRELSVTTLDLAVELGRQRGLEPSTDSRALVDPGVEQVASGDLQAHMAQLFKPQASDLLRAERPGQRHQLRWQAGRGAG